MEEEVREKEGLRTAQEGGIGLSKAPLGGCRHPWEGAGTGWPEAWSTGSQSPGLRSYSHLTDGETEAQGCQRKAPRLGIHSPGSLWI